jgi:hypothetical protein
MRTINALAQPPTIVGSETERLALAAENSTTPIVNGTKFIEYGDVVYFWDSSASSWIELDTLAGGSLTISANAPINTTWANRATAIAQIAQLTPANGWVFVSDIGVSGVMMWCNGTNLYSDDPIIAYQNNKGWLLPSLAAANASTYSQTGNVITVVNGGASPVAHNIPAVLHNGYDVYLAMGTAATGATITAGIFTNFQYVDANTFTCVSATSQTGTGAVNTNTTLTTNTARDIPIKGSLLGANGRFEVDAISQNNNSVGAKTFKVSLGGSIILQQSQTTTTFSYSTPSVVNKNSETSQFSTVGGNPGVNTSADFVLTQSITVAAANDYMALNSLIVIVNRNINVY